MPPQIDAGQVGITRRLPSAGRSVRHQHFVDDLNDAVALIDVGNRDTRARAFLVGHHQAFAAALYRQRLALHGFEYDLAPAGRDLLVEHHRIEAARHDMVGQDLVEVSPIMIPENPDDLHALAGEYVLGVLDEPEASEVAEALASNI